MLLENCQKYLKNLQEKVKTSLGRISNLLKFPADESILWQGFHSFFHFLPFESFDEGTDLFYMNKSLGFCFEIAPIVGSDEAFEEELHNLMTNVLKEGECLQFLLLADPRTESFLKGWKNAREKDSIFEKLAQKRKDFFKKDVCNRNFRCILSFSKQVNNQSFDEKEILARKETIKKLFSQFTLIKTLNAKDLINFCSLLINASFDAEDVEWNPQALIKEQLCAGEGLKVDDDQISWKGQVLKTYRIKDYPKQWSLWGMQKFIGDEVRDSYCYREPFYLHYAIYAPVQEKEKLKLNLKMASTEKQAQSPFIAKYIPSLQQEYQDCQFVRQRLHEGDGVVKTYFTVGIFSSPEKIEANAQLIESIFRSNYFSLQENGYLHLLAHLSALPMAFAQKFSALSELNLLKTTLSSECPNLLPIQAEWHGTPSLAMLLLGRRGQIASWSPFDNQNGNYNACVVGTSGSGKSFFMQDLLCSVAGTGGRCVVIDNGNSFEKLCKILKGQHIDFEQSADLCLNPFSLVSEENRENMLVLITRLVSAMASPKGRLTEVEEGLIERAVHHVWAKEQQEADIESVARYFEKADSEIARNIAYMLTSFGKAGNYGKYFCGKNNINLDKQIVVAELKALEDKPELRNVVLMLLLMTIYNDVVLGDRQTPYMIVIDEAWTLLSGEISKFIDKLSRTLRKYKGSLVIATQNIKDFIDFPAAKVAYANSDWKCLLRCPVITDDEATELGLEREKILLPRLKKKSGEFSELIISSKASQTSSVLQLRVDPFSNLLYSTTPEEYAKIHTLLEKGMSHFQAIEKLLEERGG